MTLADILNRRPARSIDDVVSMMSDIASTLPDDDGLKWFNHLYMQVTLGVRAVVGDGKAFRDPAFLAKLDVVFVLWSLRGTPPLYAAFLDSLDRLTGFAGRGLIVRV
ncbi:MAG: hypothetical protein HY048_19680 [Acidobacteria bacterium]|nr:hypothetical protein [Acidobacteriota bacterium]